MKKTFYYNIFPSKPEEEAERARNIEHKVTRSLIEIRDILPRPNVDHLQPWLIRKVILNSDIITGRMAITYNDMFEHVFRYWNLDMVRHVLAGNKFLVMIMDFTDETSSPKRYQSENIYVEESGPDDMFVLGWMDLVHGRGLRPGDEVGLYWDFRTATFHFKVLHGAN